MVTGPATADTGRSQDERARPSMSTEHAPHSPIPQPNFGPARPRSCRSTSSNGVSGSQVTLRSAPFTVNRNSVSIKISSSTQPARTQPRSFVLHTWHEPCANGLRAGHALGH